MNRNVSAITAMALLVTVVAACRKPPADDKSSAQPAQQAAPAQKAATTPATPPPAEPPKPMPAELPAVLARVNGEDVARADFDRLIKNMEIGARQQIPAERRDEIFRRSLDQLITYTLLRQESKARKLEVTTAEVDARVADMRKQFTSEGEFRKALKERGMTVERLREDARIDMVITKMMEAEVASLPPATDQEARDFYQKNPDKFQEPESVRASHILIPTQNADEATKKQIRVQVEAVLKMAKNGTDFGQLVREYSKDSSAGQGGDLGFFPRGQMVPPFEQAAFTLKVGEISGIVESQFGFHIIKVTDRKAAGPVPFDGVAGQIQQFLTEEKKRLRAEAFVADLKKKARIEVLV